MCPGQAGAAAEPVLCGVAPPRHPATAAARHSDQGCRWAWGSALESERLVHRSSRPGAPSLAPGPSAPSPSLHTCHGVRRRQARVGRAASRASPSLRADPFSFCVCEFAAMKPKEGEGGAGGFRVEAARRDRAVASLAQIEEIDLAAGSCWFGWIAMPFVRGALGQPTAELAWVVGGSHAALSVRRAAPSALIPSPIAHSCAYLQRRTTAAGRARQQQAQQRPPSSSSRGSSSRRICWMQ